MAKKKREREMMCMGMCLKTKKKENTGEDI